MLILPTLEENLKSMKFESWKDFIIYSLRTFLHIFFPWKDNIWTHPKYFKTTELNIPNTMVAIYIPIDFIAKNYRHFQQAIDALKNYWFFRSLYVQGWMVLFTVQKNIGMQ